MRDPNRIPKLLAIIGRYWAKQPDTRLGQLLLCLMSEHEDLFNVEDMLLQERMMKRLKESV